jgi:TrpR-related protein YerC/YecD
MYYHISTMKQQQRRPDPPSLKNLFAALLGLKNKKEAEEFLTDLCTPGELSDLADRWKVARLLDKGLPYREINARTGVSTATVTRVARCLVRAHGGYRRILDRMKPRRTRNAR